VTFPEASGTGFEQSECWRPTAGDLLPARVEVDSGMRMTPKDEPGQRDAAREHPEVCVVITVRLDSDGRPVGRAHAEDTEPFTFEGWLSLMAGFARVLAEQKES
jgi:hypothetical protein